MKTIFNTLILLVIVSTGLTAQHSYGAYSPKFNLRQEVGNAYLTVETTRPIEMLPLRGNLRRPAGTDSTSSQPKRNGRSSLVATP